MGRLINFYSKSRVIELGDRNQKVAQRTKEIRDEYEKLKKNGKNNTTKKN